MSVLVVSPVDALHDFRLKSRHFNSPRTRSVPECDESFNRLRNRRVGKLKIPQESLNAIELVLQRQLTNIRFRNAIRKHRFFSMERLPQDCFTFRNLIVRRSVLPLTSDFAIRSTCLSVHPFIPAPYRGYELIEVLDRNNDDAVCRMPYWNVEPYSQVHMVDLMYDMFPRLRVSVTVFCPEFHEMKIPMLHEMANYYIPVTIQMPVFPTLPVPIFSDFELHNREPSQSEPASTHAYVPTTFTVSETKQDDRIITETCGITEIVCHVTENGNPCDGAGSSKSKKKRQTKTRNVRDSSERTLENSIELSYPDTPGTPILRFVCKDDNSLRVETVTEEGIKEKENRFGYKAGVFKDIPVIIKLFIPKEARVAIPTEENKMRADRVRVVGIFPFAIEYIKNRQRARDALVSVNELDDRPIYSKINFELSSGITKAYSSVTSTHPFDAICYELQEEVTVSDFDPDMDRVCTQGVHFLGNIEDALAWHGLPGVGRSHIPLYDQLEKAGTVDSSGKEEE